MRIELGNGKAIELVQGDITRESVDAIVNAANSPLLGGGGVDGAIHRAGGPEILEQCRTLRKTHYPEGLPAGHAVATTGGRLPARHVIHTVGPVFHGGGKGEAELLSGAYRESLRIADELGLASVAFPAISTGAFGYPLGEATRIAIETVAATLKQSRTVRTVRLVVFDKHTLEIYERELGRQFRPANP